MKSNNKLTLLILSILTLGVACSSSDDDDSSNNTTSYRISSQSEYTPDGNLSFIFRYYYNSDGSLARRTNEEYNSSNSGQKTKSEFNRVVYEYNSAGLMTKELRYNSDGSSDYNNTFEYDSRNRLTKRVRTYSDRDYDRTNYWVYDGENTKPSYRERDDDGDGEIDNNTSYTYDTTTNNVVIGQSDNNMDGEADDGQWEYIYNSANQFTEYMEYSQPKNKSTWFYVESFTYDANGQLTKFERIYDVEADGAYVYDVANVEEYSTYVYETGFCDISAWPIFDELYTYWCL